LVFGFLALQTNHAAVPLALSKQRKSMSDNAFADFRLFPAISEAWELTRTGLVIIQEELYKLELWHSFNNPDISYYVSISIQKNGAWSRMPDPPFATGRNGDEALRDAMAFLTERLAA
jgi:hypothetical protein